MEGKELASSQSVGVSVEEAVAQPSVGDIIWIKLRRSLWWPAMVVGCNSNKSGKSGDKLAGNVCVRIYGSYKYKYVDPSKWHSEFQIVLKKHNCCHEEVFKKALEQLTQKSSRSKTDSRNAEKNSKRNSSELGGKEKREKTPKKNKLNIQSSNGATPGRSHELSARRTKVMQSLGLIAPTGSPFQKSNSFITHSGSPLRKIDAFV